MEEFWYNLVLTLINGFMADMGPFITFFAAINLGIEAAVILLFRRGDL
jgi:hypothetical protein